MPLDQLYDLIRRVRNEVWENSLTADGALDTLEDLIRSPQDNEVPYGHS